jgi:hypothetical protein
MTEARAARIEAEEIEDVCAGDCCMSAVKRAYHEMQARGRPDTFAFDAAMAVFNWYHPEVVGMRAENIVANWVREGALN